MRSRSKLRYAVLEKWIFENFQEPSHVIYRDNYLDNSYLLPKEELIIKAEDVGETLKLKAAHECHSDSAEVNDNQRSIFNAIFRRSFIQFCTILKYQIFEIKTTKIFKKLKTFNQNKAWTEYKTEFLEN